MEDANKTSLKNSTLLADNSSRLHEVEEKLEKTTLIVQAMWELLKQSTKIRDEDLKKQIEIVTKELEKAEQSKVTCPKCQQINAINREKCVYCGWELGVDNSNKIF